MENKTIIILVVVGILVILIGGLRQSHIIERSTIEECVKDMNIFENGLESSGQNFIHCSTCSVDKEGNYGGECNWY